ncbi:SDR family NAD(P)-dependent oxidoreductase [Cryptosporangium aurantiacum]|uniref:SDR family NAD(P)-dependent oxidoreductase n=1 Tax=Cryptosporangium aurantiacum TaxID=134849 RepID=UPI0009329C05|nr:SDR family NAD(P)-dependent oxidoreductase [Cryptosporangium aurantiacum]
MRTAMGLAWPGPDPRVLRAAVAGRTVLITGASSGIGEATARQVALAGGTVLLVARTADRLAAGRARIVSAGGSAHDHPADLSDPDAVGALVEEILTRYGGVDVVVNNAGRSIRRSVSASAERFHDYTRTIDVNYLGPVRLLLGLLPGMRERGRGHVVNISTVGVDLPPPQWTAYLASKSAFEAWVRAAAPELRADGVVTTSIHFPLVHTAMSAPTAEFARLPGMSPDEAGAVVCRALAYRPRLLSPWWARAGGLVGDALPATVDAALTRYHRTTRPTSHGPAAVGPAALGPAADVLPVDDAGAAR